MSSQRSGLGQAEAMNRLAREGPNEIGPAQRRSWLRRGLGLLAEPMFGLLLAAVAIYLALGDLGEGLTLAAFVLAVLGLTLLQEGRADRSIEALRQLSEPCVQVLRDGLVQERPARDTVRGDWVLLAEHTRAMVLLAFVAGNATLVMVTKTGSVRLRGSDPPAPANWTAVGVIASALAAVALVIYQPTLAAALQLRPLEVTSAATALLCGVSGLLMGALVRRLAVRG